MKIIITEEQKKKLFIPRKLSSGNSRYNEWNNSQPIKDGERINQYTYDGLKTGYWEHYWDNGQLFTKGSYVNGRKDGYWEIFYDNGELDSKGKYVNGEIEGYWDDYWDNGQLHFKGNHIEGKRDGYWEIYNKNGVLEYKGNYVNDNEDGYWEEYYGNGKLESKGNYVNGRRDGYWELYHLDGGLKSKGNYINGYKDGYWEWYWGDGDLEIKGSFINGDFVKDVIMNESKENINFLNEETHLILEGNIQNYINNILYKIKNLPYHTKKKYLSIALSALLGYTSYPVIQSALNKTPDNESKEILKQIIKEKEVSIFKDGTNLRLSNKGFEHIMNEEKPKLTAYNLGDGKITIGYGHAEPINTTKLKVGDKITMEQAKKYLKSDLKVAADGVRRMLNQWKKQGGNYKITQDMFDALVSMAFNMGVSGLRNTEMVKHLKQGNYKTAGQLIKQTNINPDSFPGLEIRRKKESQMFLSFLNKENDVNT
jgi:antitoxin component YwqK of YwqJK toxin-antitoxin module/GH24 family phage-related lysozyme (muramidase)